MYSSTFLFIVVHQVASTSYDQPPVGIKFDTFDSLNVELGPPGPSSDYARYGDIIILYTNERIPEF